MRNMIGALVSVGRGNKYSFIRLRKTNARPFFNKKTTQKGQLHPGDIRAMLEYPFDRRNAPVTAPAHGLYFVRADYDDYDDKPSHPSSTTN